MDFNTACDLYQRDDPDVKPTLIRTWEELSKVPDSDTHRLEINVERCNGWIHRNGGESEDAPFGHYLSTHTFYGMEYRRSTAVLQAAGFNVEIDNWDKAIKKSCILRSVGM